MTEQRVSIFVKYAKNLLSPTDTISNFALEHHPQIPLFIDVLCRQRHPHLLLLKSSANIFDETMIQSLWRTLSPTSKISQNAYAIYFDVVKFMLSDETIDDIENDFRILCEDMRVNNKRMFFVMNQLEPLLSQTEFHEIFGKKLRSLLTNDQWRFIVLTEEDIYKKAILQHRFLRELFTKTKISEPSEVESLMVLKQHCIRLENFHQVIISEEVMVSAMSLANTYFSNSSVLDKAFELLDIAATRVDSNASMMNIHLMNVVSRWSFIPLTHLQNNKFQVESLIAALQQRIFGQDQPIEQMTTLLQNAYIKLHKKLGPLCSFMLAGPPQCGKAALVTSLGEQLFGHNNAVFRVNLNNTTHCLANMTINTGLHAEHCIDLYTALQQTPYAILFFENIECFPEAVQSIVKNILAYGYISEEMKKYDFRHSIIIISTTVGSEHIIRLVQSIPEKNRQIDLMQLVLNEHIHATGHPINQQGLQEKMIEHIFPELTDKFSKDILSHTNLIPFLPLSFIALEKIIQNKLSTLKKRLEVTFNLDLHYAPEIIKFLAQEALWQHTYMKSLDKVLEHYLYSCVSHEILRHMGIQNNKSKRLLLQLNEQGQSLKCEFVIANEMSFV
jgi:ATP-dependent Clp protease ATP-binding subunit ClpA